MNAAALPSEISMNASTLDLSPKTVDGHRAAIMDKLAIRSVAGLVKYAIRNHLTNLEE